MQAFPSLSGAIFEGLMISRQQNFGAPMTACRGLQVLITRLNRETERGGFMLHQERLYVVIRYFCCFAASRARD
ncbi:hypothetical protein AGR7A_pAt20026 [Agrobacterium deltaense NCPPB 1641]|uniref:Uncharacterized protein n=1 Tax=Agrobacterium deltaense NCPPB 1641 TaxID=1183425 RepID=A0A1S7U7V2_9HYPH|nr:hypothetical protein AGR7A_pAt20026 [Agrobacterium deltaense NCPPB 1641]